MVASVPIMKWMIKPRHAISTANQPALEPSTTDLESLGWAMIGRFQAVTPIGRHLAHHECAQDLGMLGRVGTRQQHVELRSRDPSQLQHCIIQAIQQQNIHGYPPWPPAAPASPPSGFLERSNTRPDVA